MTSPATWLFVDASPVFGGHEVMLLRWIEELNAAAEVVKPVLLAREGGRLFALAPSATRCAPFPVKKSGRFAFFRNLHMEWRVLRQTMNAVRPECVIVASGIISHQLAQVVLARLHGARVLLYVPLLDTFEFMGFRLGWLRDLLVRHVYSRVPSGWVAISEAHIPHFKQWARPSGPIFVLPNTVAAAIESAPRLMPREIGPQERMRVLVLGRMDAHQKGLDLLFDWLETAKPEDCAHLHLRIVGEGPFRHNVEKRIAAHPSLAQCVELCAWMSPLDAMAGSDVLLIPSRFEGVPLVMLEAMAVGLPVVGSDIPGIRTYIPEKCLFPVGDIAAAMRIVNDLRARPPREHLASVGRQTYDQFASGAAFGQNVRELSHSVQQAFSVEYASRPSTAMHNGR